MFAQLRKSATVTESLKSMIQAPILPLEVIKLLRIGTKNFLLSSAAQKILENFARAAENIFHEL
jgi:hypothetical protein